MISRKTMPLLAAAVLSITASATRADPGGQPQPFALDTPRYLADEAAPQRRPLMELLNAGKMADPLEKAGINIYGRIEGGYTYNFNKPANDINFARYQDFQDNKAILDQFAVVVERVVDPAKKKFDIGGRMEWIFGADAGLLHSNGLFDWYDGPRDPENQADLFQLYADVAVPIGSGLLVRGGKFATILGYETVDPTTTPFYSHSFLFTFAEPTTQTGIIGIYNLTDAWGITAGFTRGWDQSTEDNNGSIDFLGGVKWTISKTLVANLNLSVGPQRPDNSEDYRTLFDFILTYAPNDKWSFAVNSDFGWDVGAAPNDNVAYWYGIAGYAAYKFNDYFTSNLRLEWFRDDDGFRSGVATNYYEITLGLNIHPFAKDRWGQYLQIRPEIRWDYADKQVFEDFSENNQVTFGIDMIYSF